MNQTQHQCGKQQLNIWYCADCRRVHLRAGQTLLSFTQNEFAEFTDAVVEIHCQGWWKPNGIALDSIEFAEDAVLTSQTVA